MRIRHPRSWLARACLLTCAVLLVSSSGNAQILTEWDEVSPPYIGQPARCLTETEFSSAWLVNLVKPEIDARGPDATTWFPIFGYIVEEKVADGVYWARPTDNPIVSLNNDYLWVNPRIKIYCTINSVHYTELSPGILLMETTIKIRFRGYQGTVTFNRGSDSGGGPDGQPGDYGIIGLPAGFVCSSDWTDEGMQITTCSAPS